MNPDELDIKVKEKMYYLYRDGFPDNYDIWTFDDFFKYNINLKYYYDKTNILMRKQKINRLQKNIIR